MEDLKKQGVSSFLEAISLIPGVVVDEGTYGAASIMIRGTVDAAGSKVLFLVDGIPYWSPSHNSIPTLGIPFEAIDRIEVIRGPGAVIYGTNAISGVINIITKSKDGSTVALTLGRDNHYNLGGVITKEFSNKSWLAFSFEHQEQDGYLGEYRFEDLRIRRPKQKEMSSALIRFGNENLHLLFQIHEEITEGRNPRSPTNPTPLYDESSFLSQEGYLVHGEYTVPFDTSTLKVYTDYNKYVSAFDLGVTTLKFDGSGKNNYRWRSGI